MAKPSRKRSSYLTFRKNFSSFYRFYLLRLIFDTAALPFVKFTHSGVKFTHSSRREFHKS